jgi:molybdopterin-guanine dinucleotide biosynthesis protein A
VDRVAELAAMAGAQAIVTVGSVDYGLPFVADDPPLGGPVGGVLFGAKALLAKGCARALVLAVDAPTLHPPDIAPLLGHPPPGAFYEGFPLPLVTDIAALPADALADWPLRRLIERAGLAMLECPEPARNRVRGANTPAERVALLQELDAWNAQKGGAD